jgi:hypothetical protein
MLVGDVLASERHQPRVAFALGSGMAGWPGVWLKGHYVAGRGLTRARRPCRRAFRCRRRRSPPPATTD